MTFDLDIWHNVTLAMSTSNLKVKVVGKVYGLNMKTLKTFLLTMDAR